MKNIFLLLTIFALSKTFALDVMLNHKVFFIDKENAYVEIYTNIPALNTLQQLNYALAPSENGKGIEARFLITQSLIRNGEIIDVNKLELNSGLIKDSTISDIFNIQRFQFKPGTYLLEIKVQDLNADSSSKIAQTFLPISAEYKTDEIFFSDLTFLEDIQPTKKKNNLSKNGYDLYPLMDNYFPQNFEKLIYYLEIYNTKLLLDSAPFVVKTEILDLNNNPLEEYTRFKRHYPKDINVLIELMDIAKLASGSFNLRLSVINVDNKILQQESYPIFRNNPSENILPQDISEEVLNLTFPTLFNDYDSLAFYTFLLLPKANFNETDQIKELVKRKYSKTQENFLEMKKFFYIFWYSRNAQSPAYEWSKYKELLNKVDHMFGTITFHGARTDRGRVYLEYGAPNDIITRSHDSNSYPYSIWYYHRIRNFNNQKFLFYDPELSNESFVLLHSTMQGELKNRKWEDYLKIRKTPSFDNIDENNSGTQSLTNDRARELWERAGGY